MTSSKALQYLNKNYPQIKWTQFYPEDDVLRNYGKGTVIRGEYGDQHKDMFILDADKNAWRWGDVIAAHLIGTVEEEKDDA